jgi:hypothetical protein
VRQSWWRDLDRIDPIWIALGGIVTVGIASFIGMWLLSRHDRRLREAAGEREKRETR